MTDTWFHTWNFHQMVIENTMHECKGKQVFKCGDFRRPKTDFTCAPVLELPSNIYVPWIHAC